MEMPPSLLILPQPDLLPAKRLVQRVGMGLQQAGVWRKASVKLGDFLPSSSAWLGSLWLGCGALDAGGIILGCGCSWLDVGSSGVLCCVCRVMGTERLGFVLAPQGCLCRMSCPFLLLCHLCCSSSWHDSTCEALLLLRAREPRLARAPWKCSWALPYKPRSPSWLVAEQLAPSLSQPPVPASISISPRSCAPDVEHLIPTLALLSRVPGSGPTSSTCCSRPKPRIYLNFDPDGK